VIPGALASITISTEGSTNVSYFATDIAGNREIAKTVLVQLDKTVPTASATSSPVPNAKGWNKTNVIVTFTGTDTASGIDFCTGQITLLGEGAGQSASGTCTDRTGNVSAPTAIIGINIDKTSPTVTPPLPATIPATEGGGARASGSQLLAAFLGGGSVTDALDASPLRLLPQVGGADVNPSTLFPLGTTTVTFRFRDAADNIGSAMATVTVVKGQPSVGGTITGKGFDAAGKYYVDLQLKNTGTGKAENATVTQLSLRTLSGTGTVMLQAPTLPISLGALEVNAATTVRIYLNRPPTVTRFSITENGTAQDETGTSYSFSIGQSVIP